MMLSSHSLSRRQEWSTEADPCLIPNHRISISPYPLTLWTEAVSEGVKVLFTEE